LKENHMPRSRLFVASLLVFAGAAVAAPIKYDIDPNHTQVVFSWNHFGFSHPAGYFEKVEGNFQFDPADPTRSSIAVTIPISSMHTGVAKLDADLQSVDFFDAAKFPTATFKSTRVQKVGARGLKVSGDLTIHGVTRPAVLDVTINKIGEQPMAGRAAAGFDAKTTIKRSDFGIAKYGPNVSDEIAIAITSETMVPKPAVQ
jgi:polyisoprenoid-binding protein YceI